MTKVQGFRTAYGPRKRFPVPFIGTSRTHQSFKDECDINVLMARYMATGVLPDSINSQEARYLDASETDFQSAMQLVAGASSLFNQLPSSIRNRFQNDPAQLLTFLQDESNRPEAERLGLVKLKPAPASLQTNQAVASGPVSGAADPPPEKKPTA